MTPDEARGTAEVTAELGAEVTQRAAEMHAAISARVFSLLPGTRAVKAAHDLIAATSYGAVALSLPVAGRFGGLVASRRTPEGAASATSSRRANAVVGALNGALGDQLKDLANGLAFDLTVRRGGADVAVTPDGLRAAYPDARGRVAVFLHGLCETEDAWTATGEKRWGDPSASHAGRLETELGYTAVLLRMNSGLRISENGAALDRLLGELVTAWPTEVQELLLVGHSMGGLVMRSAGLQARARGDERWLGRVRRIIGLGSPHHGAPLERVVNRVNHRLLGVGEVAPIARLLNRRAAGIKDLRFGSVGDEWRAIADHDAVTTDTRDERADIDGVELHAVVATLGRRTDSRVAAGLGDLLVPFASGTGRGRFPVRVDSVTHLPRRSHFDLLNHTDTWDALAAIVRDGLVRDGDAAQLAAG